MSILILPLSPHDRTRYSSHHIIASRVVRFQQVEVLPDITRLYLDTGEHVDVGASDDKVSKKLITALTQPEIKQLEQEVEYLRRYGNKDCTTMADEALAKARQPSQ